MSERPLAVVTGASSGIGTELAREAAADGHDVLLVARREDRLSALAAELPGETHTLAADLTDPSAGDLVEARLREIGRAADVLVNNAGFGQAGPMVDAQRDRLTAMIDLNVRALTDLTHRLLPQMIERGRGGVLNVSSTAAFQPGPRLAVYYATKAYVLSLSEALSEECRGTGVTVSALCPGPTQSEFGAEADMEETRLFKNAKRMTSAEVARIGWRGFRRGRRVVVTGVPNKALAVGAKLTPHALLLPVVKALQSKG